MAQPTSPSLYQELVAAGCQIDSHEADLYVKVTPQARKIVERHCWINGTSGNRCNVFRDSINGELWWEVPFAYDPFYETKKARRLIAEAGRSFRASRQG